LDNYHLINRGNMKQFLDEAQALFEYTRDMRRDFHKHPEIGLKEIRTANLVAKELSSLGMEVKTGVGQTGVVGLLEGKAPGPVVLLRFDMDALPIHEETGAEYASQNAGLMHACGHDGHVAAGLTIARILSAHRNEFSGTVKLVFQPGEEGWGGAQKMIDDGVLQNPTPDVALGIHVWNEKPVGWIGIVPGPVMAAADTFTVRILGRGGHGAVPDLVADPVIAASQVVNSLQSIVSRNVSPLKTAVVTVASIHGGDAFNVIPSEVILKGTLRSFEPQVRNLIVMRFHEIVDNVSQAYSCRSSIEITSITPAVHNDPEITKRVQMIARELIPQDTLDTESMTMGAEDMAYILNQIRGCYIFVGSANLEKGLAAPHHSSKFDFDESILPIATGLMVASTIELLGK
jgi:amidohydrolase